MLSLHTIIIFYSCLTTISTYLSDRAAYDRVNAFLQNLRSKQKRSIDYQSTEWLPNSAKIALGFDHIRGDPVCFNGECRANGFTQPIFDLNYVKTPIGSCFNKLIPENVHLNCIRTTDQQSQTIEIKDFHQLAEGLSAGATWKVSLGSVSKKRTQRAAAAAVGMLGVVGKGVGGGIGVGKLGSILGAAKPTGGLVTAVGKSGMTSRIATMQLMGGFGFSFGGSAQTRSMLTNMVNLESTTFFSTAKMTIAELSWYLPKANLSAEFRHVIENLPCCEITPATEQYIYELILNTFGTTFITSIVLGGIAQNTVIVQNSLLKNVTNQGYDASRFATMEFGRLFNFGAQSESAGDKDALASFQRIITSSRSTTQGGAIYRTDQSLNEWFATVTDNPIITSFTILPIFDLLTHDNNRFPNDPHIFNKSLMIATVLEKIFNETNVHCENNCMNHGECIYSGYFMYGICNCYPSWDGVDCSIYNPNATTLFPHSVPTTTIQTTRRRTTREIFPG